MFKQLSLAVLGLAALAAAMPNSAEAGPLRNRKAAKQSPKVIETRVFVQAPQPAPQPQIVIVQQPFHMPAAMQVPQPVQVQPAAQVQPQPELEEIVETKTTVEKRRVFKRPSDEMVVPAAFTGALR